MKSILTTFVIIFCGLFSFAQIGNIENINVEQRDDGTGMVDIHFDLVGIPTSIYNIAIEASFDGGNEYTPLSVDYLSGDLEEIAPSAGLHIVWDGLASHPNVYTEEAKVKIIAVLDYEEDEGTVTDIDGNVYQTVIIGDQEWMAENLRTTHYADGSEIHYYESDNEWTNATVGAYTYWLHGSIDGIDSDDEMLNAYGALYNWYAIDDNRGLCPEGWRVSSDEDWTELSSYLINNYSHINQSNVGNMLKSCRQVGSPLGGDCDTNDHPRWNSFGGQFGTDEFGFGALPGGNRLGSDGEYIGLGEFGIFATSTLSGQDFYWIRDFDLFDGSLWRYSGNFTSGFMVRCVKE